MDPGLGAETEARILFVQEPHHRRHCEILVSAGHFPIARLELPRLAEAIIHYSPFVP